MPRGGARPGAGRPKGRRSASTIKRREIAEQALHQGMTPLEYMLAVMRDPDAEQQRRDEMAKAAAPYMHARFSTLGVDRSASDQESEKLVIEIVRFSDCDYPGTSEPPSQPTT